MNLKNFALLLALASSAGCSQNYKAQSGLDETASGGQLQNNASSPDKDPVTGAFRAPVLPDVYRLGSSMAAMRYNPYNILDENILVDGARDLHSLGFRTIKIWMNREVKNENFYHFPEERLRPIVDSVQLLDLDQYKQVFDMDFKTWFLLEEVPAEANGSGNTWELKAQQPLSQEARDRIYHDFYQLTKGLLERYAGTGKIFILQNHEADWHITDDMSPSSMKSQTPAQQANMRDYLSLRQEALNRARRESSATQVYVYHMCEAVAVMRSWKNNRESVVRDILPTTPCDLYGYSAYDSSLSSPDDFKQSLAYFYSHTQPSFAFGRDNIAISEIGAPENSMPGREDLVRQSIDIAFANSPRVPYIVLWNGYDNECPMSTNLPSLQKSCAGFWVRRVDRTLSKLYKLIEPRLRDAATDEEFVQKMFTKHLSRNPGLGEFSPAVAFIRAHSRADFEESVQNSEEAKQEFVRRLYQRFLNRSPNSIDIASWGRNLNESNGYWSHVANQFAAEPEVRTKFVEELYKKHLKREGSPGEIAGWVEVLANGGSRASVESAFIKAARSGES
ncbi:MAG: DUF4214 domain-containing protein [Pseudobdellovibrionaceae bacterium]|nr:DUF4214 domain-containing protein [Pseudobdellovibrionaceae bacterium]